MEEPEIAKNDINQLLERNKIVEVRESFGDYIKRSKTDKDAKIRILRRAPLEELTLEEMNSSILIENGTENLLERLEVNKVIAAEGEETDSKVLFPVSNKLIYNYDFGANWIITITKYNDCNDLIEQNMIDEDELEEAKYIVIKKHKPVCINKNGLSVFDDVGGLSGFADFLGTIYEEDKDERANTRAWAKSLGWSDRKVSNKMML